MPPGVLHRGCGKGCDEGWGLGAWAGVTNSQARDTGRVRVSNSVGRGRNRGSDAEARGRVWVEGSAKASLVNSPSSREDT